MEYLYKIRFKIQCYISINNNNVCKLNKLKNGQKIKIWSQDMLLFTNSFTGIISAYKKHVIDTVWARGSGPSFTINHNPNNSIKKERKKERTNERTKERH